jgi:hypothetical protein
MTTLYENVNWRYLTSIYWFYHLIRHGRTCTEGKIRHCGSTGVCKITLVHIFTTNQTGFDHTSKKGGGGHSYLKVYTDIPLE